MNPLRLAFGCQARVGKDTACSYLQEKYGGKIVSFSTALYDILYYTQDRLSLPRKKDRKFLQMVGTEWGRNLDPDIWVNAIDFNSFGNENVFISDLRFPNEFQRLKDEGFICIRIYRNGPKLNHPSETSLLSTCFDYEIDNNGTLSEFYEKLEFLIQKIKQKHEFK